MSVKEPSGHPQSEEKDNMKLTPEWLDRRIDALNDKLECYGKRLDMIEKRIKFAGAAEGPTWAPNQPQSKDVYKKFSATEQGRIGQSVIEWASERIDEVADYCHQAIHEHHVRISKLEDRIKSDDEADAADLEECLRYARIIHSLRGEYDAYMAAWPRRGQDECKSRLVARWRELKGKSDAD